MARKMFISVVLTTSLLLALGIGTALAFEPPGDNINDTKNVFSCPDGDPVAGHPGSQGQMTAMGTENTIGAWNAVFTPRNPGPDDGPVVLCE
jgi:hypothetical protein